MGLSSMNEWLPIKQAPTDGTEVEVKTDEREGLSSIICRCAYHPDAGWCVDELRSVTHFRYIQNDG